MAFTCRPEECHELALQRVCEKYGYKTKQKALFYIIEQFENIEAERKALTKKVSELELELSGDGRRVTARDRRGPEQRRIPDGQGRGVARQQREENFREESLLIGKNYR